MKPKSETVNARRAAGMCVLVAMGACAHQRDTLEQPVGDTHTTGAADVATGVPSRATEDAIVLAPALAAACARYVGEEGPAPHFDFDSAQLRPQGLVLLAHVASCVGREGPLAGARLRITGHTDPRGSASYNDALGDYRALAAKAALVQDGLDGAAIDTASRGERDARGSDEQSFARDRRVEIELAAPSSSPNEDNPNDEERE